MKGLWIWSWQWKEFGIRRVSWILAVEGDCGAGDELLDELRGESMLSLLMLGSRDGFPARAKVRILMPLLVLVLAGMNSVVCLSAAGIAIRWG